jgi:hypothetical protein
MTPQKKINLDQGGDNNTKFFDRYAKFCKNLNSIWEINDQYRKRVYYFGKISLAGKTFFSSLFKDLEGCYFDNILKVIDLFTRSIIEEMNDSLQEDILEGEVLSTLLCFQKSKTPSINGPTIKFFLGFYDLLANYLLNVVL